MSGDDLVFVIDGLLAQVEMGRSYYEQRGMPTLPLDSVATSLITARALAESETEAPAASGECQHEKTVRHVVGGGNYYLQCATCSEIVEQSGGD